MAKIFKPLIPSLLIIAILAALFIFYSREEADFAQADIPIEGTWEPWCDEKIPSGEALDEALDILNEAYKAYKDLFDDLDLLVNTADEMVTSLKREPMCDFSVCDPEIIDMPPGLDINACLFCPPGASTENCTLCHKITGICVPACKPLPCRGQPCPYLKNYIPVFGQQRGLINSGLEAIHALLLEDQALITEEIKHLAPPGKTVGDKIPRLTFAEILVTQANQWLAPFTGCVMTEDEIRKMLAGELTPRFTTRCLDAIKEGGYWPRTWSPQCQTECKDKLTTACRECLGKADNCTPGLRERSWFTAMNCKIFKDCKNECNKMQMDAECYNCLCADFKEGPGGQPDPDWESKCLDWVCGGSTLNFVCCH